MRGLHERRVATLRFQFPFMETGSGRPDSPAVAQAAVRAAVGAAARLAPDLTLFAGGRSFGGCMISQAQAAEALPRVRGLVFIGFPLHPAKKPSIARAAHLEDVRVPMLFLQGTRDALAEAALIAGVVNRLADRVGGSNSVDRSFALREAAISAAKLHKADVGSTVGRSEAAPGVIFPAVLTPRSDRACWSHPCSGSDRHP